MRYDDTTRTHTALSRKRNCKLSAPGTFSRQVRAALLHSDQRAVRAMSQTATSFAAAVPKVVSIQSRGSAASSSSQRALRAPVRRARRLDTSSKTRRATHVVAMSSAHDNAGMSDMERYLFDLNGFVVVRNVFTPDEIAAANAAIDKVTPQRAEVAAMIAGYGATDLLSHRAEEPMELIARQAEAWDPLLDWAADTYDARLMVGTGIMPLDHPPEALERLAGEVAAYDPFRLTALHDLVSLSGSLIIGLATIHKVQPPEALWVASRIDEEWQIEQWGRDDQADSDAELKRAGFMQAFALWDLTLRR